MNWHDFTPLILLMAAFGGMAGVVAGLFGVGGGIIVVPFLDSVFCYYGMAPNTAIHMAIGTSLLTIAPTSISSVRAHAKHGSVDVATIKIWAPSIILGAVTGSFVATQLSGSWLGLIFGFFVFCIAAFMEIAPVPKETVDEHLSSLWIQKIASFSIGFISSLIGIGGGSLTVPVLMARRFTIHRAIGTASAIGLLVSIPSAIVYMWSTAAAHGLDLEITTLGKIPGCFGNVNLLAFLILVPATSLTAPYGAKLAHILPAVILRRIFAVFLALIALKMILSGLHWI
jgi:uncharacterized membrane protein YfcA